MGVVRRSAASFRDYGEIWLYVARRDPAAADELLVSFDRKLQFLSENPRAGPARPELRPRLRSFPVGAYLIFYRVIRGGIEVTRVVHGSRNLRKLFRAKRRRRK